MTKKQYRTANVSRWVEDLEDLGFLFSSTPHGNYFSRSVDTAEEGEDGILLIVINEIHGKPQVSRSRSPSPS